MLIIRVPELALDVHQRVAGGHPRGCGGVAQLHRQLAGLDLLSQSSISRRLASRAGSLAGEAALGRLRPIAMSVDELPADGIACTVRVDAAAAPCRAVSGRRAEGDLGERFVEHSCRLLRGKPAGPLPAVRIAPANLPTSAMEPGAHRAPTDRCRVPTSCV